ncbi:Endoribonuclease Dicer [Datura stramonium]|uniref:Endoribonuclease Dicer n=1 Tax=Datura stramonium TaxID=4076 RepID=A0ABS8V017_DATST|nr:Endoribonuclease Dicer [Datura stramonium]
MLIAKEHYIDYPNLSPGKLTRLRAAKVDNTEKLARVAIKCNLHNYLKGKVEELGEAILEHPLHSIDLIDPQKVFADTVESVIGATYIGSNLSMDTTWQVLKDLLQPLITLEKLEVHPATKIYELCQKNGLMTKFVDQWGKTREMQDFVDEKFEGKRNSSGKKITAQNRAAHNAYYQVVRNLIVKATLMIVINLVMKYKAENTIRKVANFQLKT